MILDSQFSKNPSEVRFLRALEKYEGELWSCRGLHLNTWLVY